MEASTLQAGLGIGRTQVAVRTPLLRVRSDQQLVALFRNGNDEAFRAIHDRYRPRLLAYVRQMLSTRTADIDDALQDVFVRAYASLRTSDRDLSLRAWLYRVAHNRCVDELRRPTAPALPAAPVGTGESDPVAETERREALARLVIDIQRLPEQQRSALLMRELSGMTYAEIASALGLSVPAVKSLLVRARLGLAQALEARNAACTEIRLQLAEADGRGVRPSWMARRHLRDCPSCRACRRELRASRRQLAALVPAVGPFGLLAKLLGAGGGASGTAASSAGGAATVGGGAGLATVTAGHVATLVAAAVATAGGAVALRQATVVAHPHHQSPHAVVRAAPAVPRRTPAATPNASAAAALVPQHEARPKTAPAPLIGSLNRPAAPAAASTAVRVPVSTAVGGKQAAVAPSTAATAPASSQPDQSVVGTLLCQTVQLAGSASCTTTSSPTTSTTTSGSTTTSTDSTSSSTSKPDNQRATRHTRRLARTATTQP